MLCCLRNFRPSSREFLTIFQKEASAGVKRCRRARRRPFSFGKVCMSVGLRREAILAFVVNHPVIPTKNVGMPPLLRKEGSVYRDLLHFNVIGLV